MNSSSLLLNNSIRSIKKEYDSSIMHFSSSIHSIYDTTPCVPFSPTQKIQYSSNREIVSLRTVPICPSLQDIFHVSQTISSWEMVERNHTNHISYDDMLVKCSIYINSLAYHWLHFLLWIKIRLGDTVAP